ncbi:MAG: PilN domain-containing protein [Pseudomonadales bacterium]|nr:PilN domain-containing protein [Pseudomonadales bacterium]
MKKTAQIKINLIPKDPFFSTIIGKLLKWALSVGRYIVIFTELVVIMSFIARFTLDRQVTDLNSSINQKKQIILAYGDIEESFRTAQEKISQYEQTEQEANIIDTFENLSKIMPDGIILEDLSIKPTTITISGQTFSQTSFNLLINNLQLSQDFTKIDVGEIESNKDKTGLSFRIRANTRQEVKIEKAPVVNEKVNLLDRTQGL